MIGLGWEFCVGGGFGVGWWGGLLWVCVMVGVCDGERDDEWWDD